MYILPQRRPSRSRIFVAWAAACLVLGGVFLTADVAVRDQTRNQALAAGESDPLPPPPAPPPPQDPPPDQQQPPPSQAQEPPPPSYPSLPQGSGDGRRVVYSNSQQRVWLVEENRNVVGSWLVSGRKGLPRPGTYKVASKSRYSSAGGGRLRLQYMVRFAKPRRLWIGFHSIPVGRRGPIQSESQLGTPTSAGCVRQRLSDAATLFNWSPVGTKVVVTP